MQDFRNLRMEKSHALAVNVYVKTATFPRSEVFGLGSQMRRPESREPSPYSYLSASIGSNLAARIAGYIPNAIPTAAEKPRPTPNDQRGIEMGKPVKK